MRIRQPRRSHSSCSTRASPVPCASTPRRFLPADRPQCWLVLASEHDGACLRMDLASTAGQKWLGLRAERPWATKSCWMTFWTCLLINICTFCRLGLIFACFVINHWYSLPPPISLTSRNDQYLIFFKLSFASQNVYWIYRFLEDVLARFNSFFLSLPFPHF